MFDSRNQKLIDHIPILDPITASDYTYNNTYQNFATKNKVGGLEMSQQHVDYGDDESGICSPPLWKNSPPRSPVHPFQNSMNHRSISPSSRALAIAKGQWELMEMIKNMPESCYELSLKDLVEKNSFLESNQEECLINKEEEKENLASTISQEHFMMQQRVKSIKRQESKGEMIRNESFEERGCCLKMFFPIPLDPKKKQQMKKSTKTTKVSPKPIEVSRNLEKDWWKKRFSCSSESDSSKTGSSTSESSGSNDSRTRTKRKKKGFLTNFWSRLCFSKSKSAE
ncbi:uncharacterized protein LOC129890027 [Solanum dulcamara]|uniref:uncharacterized protein LOC129890027 n=1 Tax=Solanum dulcamara TaxID=45834 RepID=UPI002485BD8E|nr:uncharacterized protein LOC129890027 [Solanum dulcamara]